MTPNPACIPNIGPGQRRKRLRGGLMLLGLTLVIAGYLARIDAATPWRVLVFVPAFMAALGVFQAQAQTCVALAARGKRNMDTGDEAVAEPELLARIREQSRQVYLRSAIAAALITAVTQAV
jgi:hypothetical protein